MNSQFGGGSFGTSSSGIRGTGAVDFSIVCNSQCITCKYDILVIGKVLITNWLLLHLYQGSLL